MPKNMKIPKVDRNNPALQELVRKACAGVERRHGTKLTFEQRRDAIAEVMAQAAWLDEEEDLQEQTTGDDKIDVEGKRYRPLGQPSSAV